MQAKKIRNLVAAAALATGVLGGGAIASAQTATTTAATTQTVTASQDAAAGQDSTAPAPPSNGDHARPDKAQMSAELASALGLSADQVTAAEQSARDTVDAQLGQPEKPSTPPTTDEERAALDAQMQARHDLFEQTFASNLSISVDQLNAAHVSIATTHLAADVASGKITQEQADTMLQHIQNGDAPAHGHGGPGGPGGDHAGPPPAAPAAA